MEGISTRNVLITMIAPAAWGTTYLVTEQWLPPDRPLFAAAVRALPAGLVLLAWRRQLPPPGWRLKAITLGLLNFGLFFPLIFLSAYHLPGGLAATIQALLPLVVMALAWPLIAERPTAVRVGAALVGLAGVTLLVLRNPDGTDPVGLFAAFASVTVAALGFTLVKKWTPPVDMITLTSWQLVVGGLVLTPVALIVEGAPPALDAPAVGGLAWIAIVGTGVAYVCWFRGLQLMPAGAVALIGLVNPVVGTALGVAFAAEPFGAVQALGMALVLGGVLAGQRPSAAAGPDTDTRRPATARTGSAT
ncbi:EamA family transporter [Nocardioides dubius]|uniref:EamA family transporter n=1 Tax=Nocardioides dubius TaxID=317019 RepID=A0ABP4ECU3_9ACTN